MKEKLPFRKLEFRIYNSEFRRVFSQGRHTTISRLNAQNLSQSIGVSNNDQNFQSR